MSVNKSVDLKSILDISAWEKVQDTLAAVTGMAIVAVDYKGVPVSKHSGCSAFCNTIRANAVLQKRCFKCDALAGLEAIRQERPYIYLCHCGIVDAAIPILVEDKYLGAIMFGQVRLPDDDKTPISYLLSEKSNIAQYRAADGDLGRQYEKLPVMGYDTIARIAGLLQSMTQYIIRRGLRGSAETPPYPAAPQRVAPAAKVPPAPPRKTFVSADSPVYPAASYLSSHLGERVSQWEMSQLCGFSPSYFSKIFMRDVGESFTDYSNRLKTAAAKEMLLHSSQSVATIGYMLGFSDNSYFTRMFKKYEGITPNDYRRRSTA